MRTFYFSGHEASWSSLKTEWFFLELVKLDMLIPVAQSPCAFQRLSRMCTREKQGVCYSIRNKLVVRREWN